MSLTKKNNLMKTRIKNNKRLLFLIVMSISVVLFAKQKLFVKSDLYVAVESYGNYSLKSLSLALNSHDNKPVNAITGPGLTKTSYTHAEVGTILSQNDTGGKAVSAVVMHNGYLFVPSGADHGGGRGDGAFSFYDVSDQRNPKVVFDSRNYPDVYHNKNSISYVGNWGEVHSLPIIGNRMVITETDNGEAGFSIFDTSNFYDNDPNTLPEIIGRFRYPGVTSPTNYDGYSFSLASKGGKYVYAPTGAYGLYIVDISDPTNPMFVKNMPTSELSGVFPRSAVVLGDMLVLYDVNGGRDLLVMDITDPKNPVQLSHKNDFNLGYMGFLYGSEFFSTADGSIKSYDLTNPSSITTKVYNSNTGSQFLNPEYGFGKDNNVFIGHYPGLTKWDLANPTKPIARCEPTNPFADDYAFLTPLGGTAVITSDHGHTNKLNFGVHQAEPDNLAPSAKYILPKNGSTLVSVNASVGISFTDFIDPLSINDRTMQVLNTTTNQIVKGTYSQMFGFVTFVPDSPLDQKTTYEVVLKDQGVKDWSGNAINQDLVVSVFSTGTTLQTVTPPKINPVTGIHPGETAQFSIDLQGENINNFTFSWDFGDGSAKTAYDSSLVKSHQYATGGNFVVTLYVKYSFNGKVIQKTTIQIVTNDLTVKAPSRSAKILYDMPNNRVWNVNPDNNSVSAINAINHQLVYEIGVGENPQSLALTSNNKLWVINKNSANITIINSATGMVEQTLPLPYGSSPSSIIIDKQNNVAYIALQSTQKLIKLDTNSKSIIGTLDVGSSPKNLAFDATRNKLWIARFISPDDAGKLTVVNTDTFTIEKVVSLQPSLNTTDNATNGRGLPNYLGALAISPDGTQMIVPSKKDNIYRGLQRDGLPLTFESAVRSMGAQIDLETGEENFENRIDFNNSDFPTAVTYSPSGSQFFVTTSGSSSIWVVDSFNPTRRYEISSGGDAPDDMVISPDGKKLFVHNFMSRSVVVFDSNLTCDSTCSVVKELSKTTVVTNEKLNATVLLGKQLFYNSYNTKLATDGYMSCASCHIDGTNDGRIWDFTNLGEGLRNTIDLKGKGKKGHGRSHWSSNFDEIQDFENQLRIFSLGSGLMTNSDFTNTQNTLGNPKKGKSKDLDALDAYIKSLVNIDKSPYTNNGQLTPQAEQGKKVFNTLSCVSCHGGSDFTDSPTNKLHNIGTIKTTSGQRLGENLVGIDTPTLRGLWLTAPYLHDGSASTIKEAIEAHTNANIPTISVEDTDKLVSYLNQISDKECLFKIGDACNDRDASTINDIYNDNCECIGVPTNVCNATGEMLLQRWEGVFGSLTSNLTSNINYPYSPTTTSTLTGTLNQVQNTGNDYGTKVSGILCAPQTGNYTFSVSGDDSTELYLSTDEYPSNGVLIANTAGSWTNYQQWDSKSSQESIPIYLVANRKYSFVLLHKEGGGGDHFSAGWKLPNGTLERPMPLTNFSIPSAVPTNNCEIVPTVKINGATAVATSFAELGTGASISLEPKATSSGANGWSWFGPNGFKASTQTIILNNIQANQEGTYEVYYTNADKCVSTQYYYVKVKSSLGLNDINNSKLLAYPNPTTGILIIESSDDLSTANITVSDSNGKQITRNSEVQMESTNRILINSSNWASGLYFVRVENNNEITVKKIVKK